jgi:hypothetical protein
MQEIRCHSATRPKSLRFGEKARGSQAHFQISKRSHKRAGLVLLCSLLEATGIQFSRLDGPNVLFRNPGIWQFEDVTAEAGMAFFIYSCPKYSCH